jgi:hypothetical protein
MYFWEVLDFHLHICFIWSAVLPSMTAVSAATIMKECVLYWHGLYQVQRNKKTLQIQKILEKTFAHFRTLNYIWRCALKLRDYYLFI